MVWKVENETGCKCSEVLKSEPSIALSKKAVNQIRTLLAEIPDKEWMAGLIGTVLEENKQVFVQELKLFEQEVSGTTCEQTNKGDEEMAKTKNIIGWVHSHNTMGAFASGTDHDTDGNYLVGMTVNNDFHFHARFKVKLPCGGSELIQAKVLLERDFEKDGELAEQAKSLIKVKAYETICGGYGYSRNYINGMTYSPSILNERIANTSQGWAVLKGDNTVDRILGANDCKVCGNQMGRGVGKRVRCFGCGEEVHLNCSDFNYDSGAGERHNFCYRCIKMMIENEIEDGDIIYGKSMGYIG